MTKQEAIELIAQKTKQMQDLLDETQKIADENGVEFHFSLEATGRWTGKDKLNVLGGTYYGKGSTTQEKEVYNEEKKKYEFFDGPNEEGYFYWENSSLNC